MIGIFVNLWNRITGAGAYLLDEFGGAAAAYSLRKLSLNYGGPAVRVRRASDNTEQDIGFAGNELDETALMNFVGYQNLVQRSEEFNDAYWTKLGSTISVNSTTAPDGTLTADSFISNTANGVHAVLRVFSGTPTTHAWTIYVKGITGSAYNWVLIGLYNGTAYTAQAFFNVVTGQVGNILSGTVVSPVSVGNGWWRIGMIGDLTASASCEVNVILASSNGGPLTFTGDGTSGVFLWGAQLNAGITAQPYQVTTSAARSGDGFVTKWYTQDSNGENLLLQSEAFENAFWIKINSSVTANVTTAPNGTSTADKLTETAVNDIHFVGSTAGSMTTTQVYTMSVYAKAAERNWISVYLYNGVSAVSAYFNLSTGTTGTVSVGYNASIQSVGNGWYRCSISGTVTGNAGSNGGIVIATGDNQQSYLGVVGSGVYIWGAQLSQSSWLQPYQFTTTTAILRRDASQSTAANQPRIVGGGVVVKDNGKPSIFFDGVNDHFVGTDIALPVWSIFATAVNTIPSTIGANTIYSRGSSSNNSRDAVLYLNNSSSVFSVQAQRANGVSFPTSTAYNSIKNYLLSSGIFSGSSITAFADSIAGTSVSTTIAGSVNPVTLIGATRDTGSTTLYMGGEIGEIVVYDSDRTATRADIERNIGAYYQTQWTGAGYGLLDQFGGAAAAYSLRNLSSSYRGPLIRVRRSSDNAETDIGGTFSGDLDVASLVSFTGGQNLILYSQDFNTNWFTLRGSVTANTTIAPDGTLTADSVICNTTSSNGLLALYVVPSPATTITEFTGSCYIKAGNRGFASIVIYDDVSAGCRQYFNLITGQLGSDIFFGTGVTKVGASIQNVGNGWYRCSLTVRHKVSSNIQLIVLPANQADNVLACTVGDFGYVWGAQLNTGILQPYIPTTTAAVNGANAFVTKWYTQDNNYQNLLLQSQTFTTANWIKNTSTVTANAGTDPFGGNTATRWISDVGATTHSLSQSQSLTLGQSYTISFYVKSNTGSNQLFTLFGCNTLLSSDLTATTDWQRFSFSFVANSTTFHGISRPSSNAAVDLLIYGAQLNEGPVAFPYTATTTTASQRRDAIQATAASQPRIVNAGGVESEGNKPALFFDGTDDSLATSNAVITSNNFSTFSAFASNAATGMNLITQHDGTSAANRTVFIGSSFSNIGSAIIAYNDGTTGYSAITTSTQPFDGTGSIVYSDTNGSGLTTIGFNGVQDGSVNGTVWIPLNTSLRMGALLGASSFLLGRISETFLYNSRQTSPQAISSNINSYYRIYWQGNGTALLDSFSGASAAYSLRNLSSAYTGPLIRVRRSNDNVERDIYGTFGGDLDIASLVAFVGANSGFVTTWYDQSGSARHATQGTAANQPRIVNAGVVDTTNGKPSLFFDGAGDALANAGVTSSNWTILAVVNVGAPNYGGIYGSDASDNAFMYNKLAGGYGWRASGLYNGLFNSVSGTQSLFLDINGSLGSMYVNGVAGSVNQTLNGTSSVTYTRVFGNWAGLTYSGNAQELIVYNSSLPSIRNGTQSNINNYYKIY